MKKGMNWWIKMRLDLLGAINDTRTIFKQEVSFAYLIPQDACNDDPKGDWNIWIDFRETSTA
jgi:hypothetical protein